MREGTVSGCMRELVSCCGSQGRFLPTYKNTGVKKQRPVSGLSDFFCRCVLGCLTKMPVPLTVTDNGTCWLLVCGEIGAGKCSNCCSYVNFFSILFQHLF